MDTVFVITQPPGFWELSNLGTLLSAIGTIAAVMLAYKAYRRFEYQTVKPRQIEEVLTLYSKLKTYEAKIYKNNSFYGRLSFDTLEVTDLSSTDDAGFRKIITPELQNTILYFDGNCIYPDFHSLSDSIYLPNSLKCRLINLFIPPDSNKYEIPKENLTAYCVISAINSTSLVNSTFNTIGGDKNETLESYIYKIKDVYLEVEKWLYMQGLNNLNLRYYKPSIYKKILHKLF